MSELSFGVEANGGNDKAKISASEKRLRYKRRCKSQGKDWRHKWKKEDNNSREK